MHHWLRDCLGQTKREDLREPAGLAADGTQAARGFNLTEWGRGLERKRQIRRLHSIKHVCLISFSPFTWMARGSGLDTATISS